MIVEKFNIFKKERKNEKYILLLNDPSEHAYYILLSDPHESSDVISAFYIDSNNINTVKYIAYFDNIKKAKYRLDYIIGKFVDIEWRNINNWSITTIEELRLLLIANKFNI